MSEPNRSFHILLIYSLIPKFHVKHEGFSFFGPRKSDKGADTAIIFLQLASLLVAKLVIWAMLNMYCELVRTEINVN